MVLPHDSEVPLRNLSVLETGVAGAVGLPGSRVYSEGTRVFAPAARVRKPLAVVRPAGQADVASVLRWATAEGYRVSVRSGGHSFDGFPVQEDTVLLDMSGLDEARLDANGLLHAGPGVRILELAKDLDPAGRAAPTGECPTVALGGLVLGGGFGYATRKFGLTLDSLVEATLVTATGEEFRVSRDRNPYLFWACRGGAGTAGVITELVLRTFAVDRVTAVEMAWRWEAARDVIQVFDRVIRTAPRELDLKLKIRTTGIDRFIDMTSAGPPDAIPGVPLVHIDGQFIGMQSEAEALLKPLVDHPALARLTIKEESYFAAMLQLVPLPILMDPAPEVFRPTRVASDFMTSAIGQGEADAIVRFVEEVQYAPELWGGAVLIEPCDGAVRDAAADHTAFPHREQRLLLQWELFNPISCSQEQNNRLDGCLRAVRDDLRHAISGGRYVNYADRLDSPSHWWAANSARLAAISAQVDPKGTLVSRLKPVAGPGSAPGS